MITSTEIARGIHRVSVYDEEDLLGKLTVPGASYNLFVIAASQPAIINTMFRRTFNRLRSRLSEILDPASLRYIVVPHHEGDSSGAVNQWLADAPNASVVCSELCAMLSLRDFVDQEPLVVSDDQMIDLGSHRLRFLMTPQINQWDSLMIFEETTGTLFSNDLFAMLGNEISTDRDVSQENIEVARQVGYQPDDRAGLLRVLDKLQRLPVQRIATMHGPVLTAHLEKLFQHYRENSLTPVSRPATSAT